MYLDKYNLPCQKDGDCSDQLQRVGMIGVGNELNPVDTITIPCYSALKSSLQPFSGVYTRFTGALTTDVTADQLVPVFAYWTLVDKRSLLNITMAMLCRFGFAQNIVKDNDPTILTMPDFMLLRVLPFIFRISLILYPLTCVIDILLILAAVSSILQGSYTNTDDNNIIITLATCKARMQTPFSYIAAKLYKHYRKPPGAEGALLAYHAASTGGNPEIAQLWIPIVEKF